MKIKRAIDDYPVVLTSSGVRAAYYLGDFSFEFNNSVMLETDSGDEFGLDRRTGRQVVSSLDSILRIAHECGPTLVIVDHGHHRYQDTLETLDELMIRLIPAANISMWKIGSHDANTGGFKMGYIEPMSLNCRPVTLSIAP